MSVGWGRLNAGTQSLTDMRLGGDAVYPDDVPLDAIPSDPIGTVYGYDAPTRQATVKAKARKPRPAADILVDFYALPTNTRATADKMLLDQLRANLLQMFPTLLTAQGINVPGDVATG